MSRIRCQQADNIIACPLKAKVLVCKIALDVKYPILARFRDNPAGRSHVDGLRGDGRAHHIKPLALPVHDNADLIAEADLAGLGKRFRDDHLVVPLSGEIVSTP